MSKNGRKLTVAELLEHYHRLTKEEREAFIEQLPEVQESQSELTHKALVTIDGFNRDLTRAEGRLHKYAKGPRQKKELTTRRGELIDQGDALGMSDAQIINLIKEHAPETMVKKPELMLKRHRKARTNCS